MDEKKMVMSEDVALSEIKGWAEALGNEEFEPSRKLLFGVMRGRISFDEATKSFTVKLLSPIEMQNGKTLDTLAIKEPKAEMLREAAKSKGEIETTLRMIAAIAGQPAGIVDRIGMRDLTILGEVLGFFA